MRKRALERSDELNNVHWDETPRCIRDAFVISSLRSSHFRMVYESVTISHKIVLTSSLSLLAAYDSTSDKVLILDTARFKYQPHWIPLSTLCSAMLLTDSSSGRSRGWAVIGMKEEKGIVVSKLLNAEVHEEEWREKVKVLKCVEGEENKIKYIKENGGTK